MKTRFTALLTLTLSCASLAQTDPVAEQVQLTQDAVRLALQEIEIHQARVGESADWAAKYRAFSAAAAAEMQAYEGKIRSEILAPLQVLIAQYNTTVSSSTLNERAKADLLRSLKSQLDALAASKNVVYGRLVESLARPLGELPLAMESVRSPDQETARRALGRSYSENAHYSGTFSRSLGGTYRFTPAVRAISANGRVEVLTVGAPIAVTDHAMSLYRYYPRPQETGGYDAYNFFRRDHFLADSLARTHQVLLEGCYSVTCFFQSQQTAMSWEVVITHRLGRPITIRLADGESVRIQRSHESTDGSARYLVLADRLMGVNADSVVLALPAEVPAERLTFLRRVDAALASAPFDLRACRAAVGAARAEIARLREGGLSPAESALFASRANALGADRAACLD